MSNVRRATTGGRRAAFVIVLHSMWRRAEGKFALIVLALWLLIAIVSLFWTPQSLWATDGYHVWAKPSAEHWLGTDGTGGRVQLAAGRLTYQSCDRAADRSGIYGLGAAAHRGHGGAQCGARQFFGSGS